MRLGCGLWTRTDHRHPSFRCERRNGRGRVAKERKRSSLSFLSSLLPLLLPSPLNGPLPLSPFILSPYPPYNPPFPHPHHHHTTLSSPSRERKKRSAPLPRRPWQGPWFGLLLGFGFGLGLVRSLVCVVWGALGGCDVHIVWAHTQGIEDWTNRLWKCKRKYLGYFPF